MPVRAHSRNPEDISSPLPDRDGEPPVAPEPLPTGRGTVGLTKLLHDSLDLPSPDDPTVSGRQKVIRQVLNLAGRGDLKTIQEIWTRLEGKPGPAFEPSEEEPGPLTEDMARRYLELALDGTDDEAQEGDEDAGTHDED
ncbi:hypothetical protein [Aquisphaera insulae]|uniref:hypothetical protein n=1 Tax=Aquisphaera insulae TaxID=2712864 RepID=UPI0013EA1D9D|nr:hypothetical protein [Aquisphaera insulae]